MKKKPAANTPEDAADSADECEAPAAEDEVASEPHLEAEDEFDVSLSVRVFSEGHKVVAHHYETMLKVQLCQITKKAAKKGGYSSSKDVCNKICDSLLKFKNDDMKSTEAWIAELKERALAAKKSLLPWWRKSDMLSPGPQLYRRVVDLIDS